MFITIDHTSTCITNEIWAKNSDLFNILHYMNMIIILQQEIPLNYFFSQKFPL